MILNVIPEKTTNKIVIEIHKRIWKRELKHLTTIKQLNTKEDSEGRNRGQKCYKPQRKQLTT